jgi:hypothetical protein
LLSPQIASIRLVFDKNTIRAKQSFLSGAYRLLSGYNACYAGGDADSFDHFRKTGVFQKTSAAHH